MCINNNFIEDQAFHITEKILGNSIYKVVRIEGSRSNTHNQKLNGENLITKLILEDENGVFYSIKPDQFGLMFANGEVSYKKYCRLQKKDDLKVISYSIIGMGIIISMMIGLMKLLLV